MIRSNLATKRPRRVNAPAQGAYRRYPVISRLSICLLLTFLFGCQKQNATIAGVTIPVPAKMQEIPDKVFEPIPGFEDGQAAYQGNVTPGEIFTFYQETMEARGWKPTTFMVSKKDQMAYTKGDKICLVWYTPNADGTTTLTIMIGTSKPPA